MDIFDISVKLGLINGLSGGLTMIVNQFTNLQVNIRNTQTTLMSFRAALGGSWEWQGGKKILRGMADVVSAGGKVLDQQALILAAGWKQAEVAEMSAAAYRAAASVMAATPVSALVAEPTLLGIFANVAKAEASLPALLKANAVMAAAGRGAGVEKQLAYGLKALDLQGALINRKIGEFNVAAYEAGLHELMALTLAIPHTLDMNQLMLFTRMAGSAAQAMNCEDYARTYGKVIASMGRTGSRGLQMLYKTFLGGNISKATAAELIKAGVVAPSAIHHIKGSSRDILDYHGIVGWQELTTNAADWAHDVLFPLLAKHDYQGVTGMMQALGSLPATVQRLLSFLLTNWAQIERGKEMIEQAEETYNYDEATAKNWKLNVQNFELTWQGVMQALGAPAAGFALPLLRDLTGDIKDLTRFLEDHPDVAMILDEIGVSLGAILATQGLKTGLAVLEKLAEAAGLRGLVAGPGLFGKGAIGEIGLKLLTGPTGLFALAIGIDALGKALPSIPTWLTHFASKQAVDVDIAKLLKRPGVLGRVFDLGGDTDETYERRHPPTQATIDATYAFYRTQGVRFPQWLLDILPLPPTPLGNHAPVPLPLPPLPPLPPVRAAVNVTLHSPISLPIPAMSETDIQAMFRRAIYSHNEALLKELARAIVAQQRTHLLPVIEDAIHQMQKHSKRQSFLDRGGALGNGYA